MGPQDDVGETVGDDDMSLRAIYMTTEFTARGPNGTGRLIPQRATMSQRIRVFVISEVRLYRDGLCEILGRDERFDIVGNAVDASAAIDLVRRRSPDAVVLSTSLPSNRDWIRPLAEAIPDAAVVALGLPEVASDVIAWVEAGASVFVTSEASLAELCSTIEQAYNGEAQCSPRMLAAVLKRLSTPTAEPPRSQGASLTVREREIAAMLGSGLSNKEIATRLRIQVTTVKNHVHNILEKLQVRRRAEAAVVLAQLAPWQAPGNGSLQAPGPREDRIARQI